MTVLDEELKLQLISIAISSLTDEFVHIYGRFPALDELEQFANTLGASLAALEALLDARNPVPVGSFCQILTRYPTFWEDLARNIAYESIPRKFRRARNVT